MWCSVVVMIPKWCIRALNGNHHSHPKERRLGYTQRSEIKTMLVFFFTTAKEFCTESSFQKGQTVTSKVYLSILERPWMRIVRVRPEYKTGRWFLLHNQAPADQSVTVQQILVQKQVCVPNYPHHILQICSPVTTFCSLN